MHTFPSSGNYPGHHKPRIVHELRVVGIEWHIKNLSKKPKIFLNADFLSSQKPDQFLMSKLKQLEVNLHRLRPLHILSLIFFV